MEMADSVKQHGILVPVIVRPKEGGRYEMIAGHRRKLACTLIAKLHLPCIVRELTDEEATISMVMFLMCCDTIRWDRFSTTRILPS